MARFYIQFHLFLERVCGHTKMAINLYFKTVGTNFKTFFSDNFALFTVLLEYLIKKDLKTLWFRSSLTLEKWTKVFYGKIYSHHVLQ